MVTGCLDLLFLGTLSWLFEKSHQKKIKEQDRVEIDTHTWMGMSGKTRYNRRYLGPIEIKTFLSTSRKMVKAVDEYESTLNNLLSDYVDYQDFEKNNDIYKLLDLFKNVSRYMRQIDRRQTLRCYSEWRNDHSESFSAYQNARSRAINLDSKLEDAKRKHGF